MDGPQLIRSLKPMLMGQDPLERERIHGGMRLVSRIVSYRTIGAVDTALWDLAGKIAGLPVHALMGTCRTSILAYASSQVLPDIAAYVDQAQTFKANGWHAYKIHPPRDPDQDIKVCEAVRKAVGDDYRLMLDSTWSYNYTDALRVGRAIEEMGYYWYEDPLSDEDIYNYVKLREKLDIPIMATEFPAGGLDTYPIWLTERATDYLRGDIPNKGGLTTMLKTAHLGEAFGHQVRSPSLRQFAEQPGQPASVHGDPQHHDVRGAAAGRGAQIRHGEGAGDRSATGCCMRRPARAWRRDRLRSDQAEDGGVLRFGPPAPVTMQATSALRDSASAPPRRNSTPRTDPSASSGSPAVPASAPRSSRCRRSCG